MSATVDLETCPICKGTGESLKRKYANGVHVHFGDGVDEYITCWMCAGKGEVKKKPSPHNIFIHEYCI